MRGRKRFAVCIEEVDGNPNRMGRYLVKRLGNGLAKRKQIARSQRQKTGRTWGYFDRERMEPYFQTPVVVTETRAEERCDLYVLAESRRVCWQIDIILDGAKVGPSCTSAPVSRLRRIPVVAIQAHPVSADPPASEPEIEFCSQCGKP